jgi:hypothetical protein
MDREASRCVRRGLSRERISSVKGLHVVIRRGPTFRVEELSSDLQAVFEDEIDRRDAVRSGVANATGPAPRAELAVHACIDVNISKGEAFDREVTLRIGVRQGKERAIELEVALRIGVRQGKKSLGYCLAVGKRANESGLGVGQAIAVRDGPCQSPGSLYESYRPNVTYVRARSKVLTRRHVARCPEFEELSDSSQ